jgi:hypothetical protein
MYSCDRKQVCATLENEKVSVMLDAECREAEKEAERGTATISPAPEAERPLLVGCEAMLKVLGRDDNLRRIYVRRRWQGLVEEIDIAFSQGLSNARKWR